MGGARLLEKNNRAGGPAHLLDKVSGFGPASLVDVPTYLIPQKNCWRAKSRVTIERWYGVDSSGLPTVTSVQLHYRAGRFIRVELNVTSRLIFRSADHVSIMTYELVA